ncbi:MAG: membrane dipeptidase, partial [Bacteroidota bacterium]
MPYPVIDLHCDLLAYLNGIENADPMRKDDLGCSFPALSQGNVKLQVMAIYTPTKQGSSEMGLSQSRIFKELFENYPDQVVQASPKNISSL